MGLGAGTGVSRWVQRCWSRVRGVSGTPLRRREKGLGGKDVLDQLVLPIWRQTESNSF